LDLWKFPVAASGDAIQHHKNAIYMMKPNLSVRFKFSLLLNALYSYDRDTCSGEGLSMAVASGATGRASV